MSQTLVGACEIHCGMFSTVFFALSVDVIVELLELWDIISEVELQPGVEDSHIWRFSLCGQYTAKSAYDRFFSGGNKI